MRITGNLKITNALLKSLQRGNEAKYADTDIPGFQVVVGAKTIAFYIHKKLKQKIYHIAIGKYPDVSLDDARREALKILGSLANHQTINAISSRKQPTIQEAMDYYLTKIKNQSCVNSCFQKFNSIRKKYISDITKNDVAEIHRKLKATPSMANSSVRYLSAAISSICKNLNTNISNPATGITMYHEKPRTRFLAETEAPKMIDALGELRDSPHHKNQAEALLMMIYTGARKSNVLKMNLKNIGENNVWIIPNSGNEVGERSKNGKEMIIPLNEFAIEILEKRRRSAINGYLFTYRGKPLANVRGTFENACRKAGVEGCHIHDLRRTMGSWMLMQGTPIEVVSKTLGHSSIRITEQVYAHLLPGKISDATSLAIRAMKSGKA